MKFKIRFADQIVGVFLIVAILALILIIVMLGRKQRWFARNYSYKTYFDSASGLSPNMAIQYKGFTIGKVTSLTLTEDERIEVLFSIQDTYNSRVKRGSLVDLSVSPIGLGNQFRFYPGLGEPLPEGDFIPTANSPEGKALVQSGLARLPAETGDIAVLMGQVSTLLTDIDSAIKGTEESTLGRTLLGVEGTIGGLNTAIEGTDETTLGRTLLGVEGTIGNLPSQLDPIFANLNKISADLTVLTEQLKDPNGTVASILNSEGPVYVNLEGMLTSLAGILRDLDKTTDHLPANMGGILMNVRTVLQSVQDVLIAVANNPLLKGGIPAKVQSQSSGTNLRDISF
ncbi:MAG: MlaD family protein [Spirochaetaceae bacterium]|jgi:phospholipid/cholesterol/gamma-HCH transport system substrate-binding protein|nr:MlaD family protein [Spirochaetaceae bacterium]